MDLQQFAEHRAHELLARVNREMANVAQHNDVDAIHDLRVSIRRFTQALRALQTLFPKTEVKRMRRKLRTVMDVAAEIRNRDIALQLLNEAQITEASPLWQRLASERDAARGDLTLLARQWRRRNLGTRWARKRRPQ